MLKKPASKIVNWVENEDDKQWKEVVIPVEEWGKIVTKMDVEVSFTRWPIHRVICISSYLIHNGPFSLDLMII